MKRALAMLLALILCVGCAPAGMRAVEPSQLIGRPFSARMLLEWNGKEYSGSIARDAQGGLSLALTGESLILPVSFACGTGACASLVMGLRQGRCDSKVTVRLPYGHLMIEQLEDGQVTMAGPAVRVAEGTYIQEEI